jgi:transposase-like protein
MRKVRFSRRRTNDPKCSEANRSRFSNEQIIAILQEQEAGMPTAEVCRRHGISPATFYKWKAKYGGLEVSEAELLASARLFVAKTTAKVLAPGTGKTKIGYMWAMARDDGPQGGADPPAIVYTYGLGY